MGDELDYRIEAANQTEFADGVPGPPVHPRARRRRRAVDAAGARRPSGSTGSPWAEFLATAAPPARQRAGETIFRFAQGGVHRLGVFNGDPHPGNYRFPPDGSVTFLDFGLVKRWTPGEWEAALAMLDAILAADPTELVAAMEDVGFLPPGHGSTPQAVCGLRRRPVPAVPPRRSPSRGEFVADTVARIADVRGEHAEVVRQAQPAGQLRHPRPGRLGRLRAAGQARGRGSVAGHPRRVPARRPAGHAPRRAEAAWQPSHGAPSVMRLGAGMAEVRAACLIRQPRAPFAPWDRRELPGLFDVEESARRVGNYTWAEMRLFEALGGWVATVPELDVKMRLGTHCYKHAWHAELWHKRLPELREMNPDRLTVPANDDMVAFVDALTEPEAPELTIEKLVGVYRVLLPALHRGLHVPPERARVQITDAPTIRSLKFILGDEYDDWREGEMIIQSLIDHRGRRRAGRRPPGAPGDADGRGGWHRRPGHARPNRQQEAVVPMKKFMPVDELARDERFERITMRTGWPTPASAP